MGYGPTQGSTVEKIARKRDIAPVWRELDEVEHLEIIKEFKDLRRWLKEPGKILGKNLWVMGPLKETTVEEITRPGDIAPVKEN